MKDAETAKPAKRFQTSFYGIVSILIFGLAMFGFSTTYFTPLAQDTFSHPNPYIHLHAATGTLWLLAYIVQTHLIANKNRSLHIKLGKFGSFIAIVFVITGILTFHFMTVHGLTSQNEAQRFNAEVIGVAPFTDLISFSVLVSFAIAKRHQGNVHKRLMYLASCLFIGPSVFRIVQWSVGTIPTPDNGALFIPLASTLFYAAGPLYDKFSTGKVDRTYVWAIPVWLVNILGIPLSTTTGFWVPVAQMIASF